MPEATDKVVADDNVAVILLLLIGRLANVVTVLTPISLFMVFLSAAAIKPLVDSLATAYVVLGGVAQVPSPRMKLDVLPLSCLNKPLAVVEANPYVVLVGTTHVPSPRKKEACLPAAGAGTKPAFPAVEEVAAPHIGICGVGIRPRDVHVHLATTVKSNGIVLAIGRVSNLNKT